MGSNEIRRSRELNGFHFAVNKSKDRSTDGVDPDVARLAAIDGRYIIIGQPIPGSEQSYVGQTHSNEPIGSTRPDVLFTVFEQRHDVIVRQIIQCPKMHFVLISDTKQSLAYGAKPHIAFVILGHGAHHALGIRAIRGTVGFADNPQPAIGAKPNRAIS